VPGQCKKVQSLRKSFVYHLHPASWSETGSKLENKAVAVNCLLPLLARRRRAGRAEWPRENSRGWKIMLRWQLRWRNPIVTPQLPG